MALRIVGPKLEINSCRQRMRAFDIGSVGRPPFSKLRLCRMLRQQQEGLRLGDSASDRRDQDMSRRWDHRQRDESTRKQSVHSWFV